MEAAFKLSQIAVAVERIDSDGASCSVELQLGSDDSDAVELETGAQDGSLSCY